MLLVRFTNLVVFYDLNRLFVVLIRDVKLLLDTISYFLPMLQRSIVLYSKIRNGQNRLNVLTLQRYLHLLLFVLFL